MEPVYYVIAILGCADGSTQCTPVATVQTHFASQAACTAGTQDALLANSDLDFPTLVAQCRAESPRKTAAQDRPEKLPASALRG
jgi:hypothetical protein